MPSDASISVKDLAALPGTYFEALKGDRRRQYSIRINDQWRIYFEWPNRSPGPQNVEIVDYHRWRKMSPYAKQPADRVTLAVNYRAKAESTEKFKFKIFARELAQHPIRSSLVSSPFF